MKNAFVGLLIFLIAIVLFTLAVDRNSSGSPADRYDAYVSYDEIEACNHYVDFMECVVDRIDDVAVKRIYKNNIYTTVRNRAALDGIEPLMEACDMSLSNLANEVALHKYECTIDSDDILIRNLVLPEGSKEEVIVPTDESEETNKDEIDAPATGNIVDEEPELSTGTIEIIKNDNGTGIDLGTPEETGPIAYTRVEVLQNRVGFLRIRERASTNSFELGRLGIGDVVNVIDEQAGWYLVTYGENGSNQGRVSGKYVRNIGLSTGQ